MKQEVSYIHSEVVLCHLCNGRGVKQIFPPFYNQNADAEIVECESCQGSGRLRKDGYTVINFYPYANGDNIREGAE